jgi:predicted PurR-regulated permease PerM
MLIVIWGGAAWWLFGRNSAAWGTFIIIWGVFVSIIDNLIRPWLIGLGIDMPLSLTVLGVFGGFVVFGFLGLFVGPALIAIAYTLLMAWRTAIATHPATAGM